MLDSVLNMSKKQIEDAIRILNPCMNDYLYVFDLKEDYYVISKHATERFILVSVTLSSGFLSAADSEYVGAILP